MKEHPFIDHVFHSFDECPHCEGEWNPEVMPIVNIGPEPQVGAIFICRHCKAEVRATLRSKPK